MNDNTLWQTKLAARLHDPAEKALVLLRDPAGHENGTSRALFRLLGYQQLAGNEVDADNDQALAATLFTKGVPAEMYRHVQRADWWAAAADRPQWPMQEIKITTRTGEQRTLAVANWAQVRWTTDPVLIHPLTGQRTELASLTDTEVGAVKQRSFDHFATLLRTLGGIPAASKDWRNVLLAFWRFGPELAVTGADTTDNQQLGELWDVLPADTRVPDHSIWDHLDLASAFAGAFAADSGGDAALLTLAIGPVQPFIASARKMDDLWAGSHLLSRLAWETMRPVAEALGPDAVLFPRLRGIPQVDLWLRDRMGLPNELFRDCEWTRGVTDANPLFSASLPNRFVAVVPAAQARSLAEACRDAGRKWLLELGENVVDRLLDAAGLEGTSRSQSIPAYAQIREQLAGFPEVHWAAVPFSLVRCRDEARQRDLDPANLLGAMAPFFGVAEGKTCGFLDTAAWKVLAEALEPGADGQENVFFAPNPGALYPAVYDLAERVMTAAKAARPFDQRRQEGWRESLSGEMEWLTTDRSQLEMAPGSRKDTLWSRLADRKPAWAKKGEHLSGLSAIKRLWPTLFAEETGKALSVSAIGRFVVSTHTMALAHQLDQWLQRGGQVAEPRPPALADAEAVALPRRLARRHGKSTALHDARRIPGLIEAARDAATEAETLQIQRYVRRTLGTGVPGDEVRLETYYGILMMDGDRMGAILSGADSEGTAITYAESFHPQVRRGFDERARQQAQLARYGRQRRAVSPGRHLAISSALNDFAQTVARHVVEEEHLGRVIYAGGDDVLAMLPVADLLPCMQRLRDAYSGTLPGDQTKDWGDLRKDAGKLHLRNGFAYLKGRLMRMMGTGATASTGAIVAHHQAPLSAVMRELRAAERRAKMEGGRNAFSITVIKRSGGALYLTAKWGESLSVLNALIEFLRDQDTSRRAVYNSLAWLTDLPEPDADGAMLEHLLAFQLARQSRADTQDPGDLACRLTKLTLEQPLGQRRRWLENFLSTGEFLARETRGVPGLADCISQESAA